MFGKEWIKKTSGTGLTAFDHYTFSQEDVRKVLSQKRGVLKTGCNFGFPFHRLKFYHRKDGSLKVGCQIFRPSVVKAAKKVYGRKRVKASV